MREAAVDTFRNRTLRFGPEQAREGGSAVLKQLWFIVGILVCARASTAQDAGSPRVILGGFVNKSGANEYITYDIVGVDGAKQACRVDRWSEVPRMILENVLADLRGVDWVKRELYDREVARVAPPKPAVESEAAALPFFRSRLQDGPARKAVAKALKAHLFVEGTVLSFRPDEEHVETYGAKTTRKVVYCTIQIDLTRAETGERVFSAEYEGKATRAESNNFRTTEYKDADFKAVRDALSKLREDPKFARAVGASTEPEPGR